ncbi:uncharacterized protein [Periplaneta americana]|uniref:uncharacterized protein n=1 Tax=Periplaneta americana TaxID=6978 RepID=UPI0037E858D5
MKLCSSSYFFLLFLVVIIKISYETPVKWKCSAPLFFNGRVKLMSKGRTARFKCNPTFQLLGERYTTCMRGKWESLPLCVKSGCDALPSLTNGQILESYRGAVVKFLCNPGYALYGSSLIYCDGDNWNATTPQCKASEKMAQTWCDFESQDLCGWTQDPHHNFDWSRQNFQTPSGNVGTGPSFDHTLGPDKGGYYMFIESSSPRMENDTARLYSPVYTSQLTASQPSCFTFWYHMYGATTGSLHVYIKPENVEFGGTLLPRFTKTGDQGNQWFQAIVLLPSMNQSFQVVIEAVRGASYVSDIAIDDVKIANGSECLASVADLSPPTESVKQNGGGNEIYDSTQSCRLRCQGNNSEVIQTTATTVETPIYAECECHPGCLQTMTCCSDFASYCMPESPPEDVPVQTRVTKSTITNRSFHPPPPLPPLPPIPSSEVTMSLSPNATQTPLIIPSSSQTTKVMENTELPTIRYKPVRTNWTQDDVEETLSPPVTEGPSKRIPIPTEPTPLILQPPTAIILPKKQSLKTEIPFTNLTTMTTRIVKAITTVIPFNSTVVSSTTTKTPTTKFIPTLNKKTSATTLPQTTVKIITTVPTKITLPAVPTRRYINVTSTTQQSIPTPQLRDLFTTVKTITYRPKKIFPLSPSPPLSRPTLLTKTPIVFLQTTTMKQIQDDIDEKLPQGTTKYPSIRPTRAQAWRDARRKKSPREKELLSMSGIIGILVAVTLTLAAIGIAAYFVVRNRRRKRMQSCMADDSDVRFLTSDEALDFSLARPIDSGDDDL